MTEQRIWTRVEAPWAPQGHALTANFGGETWYAWRLKDGRWALRYGPGRRPQAVYPDWPTLAGRLKATAQNPGPPPSLSSPNPVPFLVAGAVTTGAGFALRNLIAGGPQMNPGVPHGRDPRIKEVARCLPWYWRRAVTAGPGGVTVRVSRGRGAAVQARTRHLTYPVRVLEV